MEESQAQPVEISTRMRHGEWTPESMAELTAGYQRKLMEMGAPAEHIVTEVDQHETTQAEEARGNGEVIHPGEATRDSQGLGAVFGDAERSAIDAPPTERAMKAPGNPAA